MNRTGNHAMAFVIFFGLLCPGLAQAQAQAQANKKGNAIAEDVMDHRTMAEAHRKAADCLEAGKAEKECRAQLAKDCKGVGIGKSCGMKDRHKH